MKIAVIGFGNVGGTLGRRWAQLGHDVTFAVRDPADMRLRELLAASGPRARASAVSEAVDGAEVVALAVPWDAAKAAVASLGDLKGKVLLDCTNPLTPDLSGLTTGLTTSGAEQIAGWAPNARVVKIFNTTGSGNMASPRYGTVATTMLYCGDEAAAKAVAATLASDLGFEALDAGPLTRARLLEPMALLWITLAFKQGFGVDFTLQLMRRPHAEGE